ncbi:hypothetical protein [Herbidospora daliensis]|uniref:hypothetical protein n=1 Tax=Herbidospora daliensis TaxID=295585 RepID=UPI000780EC9C|nr:hypothetical protein [Herbidospora daliensis]
MKLTDFRHPLLPALSAAVQLEIAALRAVDDELRATQIAHHTGRASATLLGEKGDVLLYGGKGAGETFTALARGLACLAFAPGGVTAFGQHWCADHRECLLADREVAARREP